MRKAGMLVAAVIALSACATGPSTDFPVWMRVLKWMSGDTSETAVATTLMSPHLQVSLRTAPQPGDAARAQAVLEAARAAMARYRSAEQAERDGYKPFSATGVIGEEVHYANGWRAAREASSFDPDRPSALLYRRTSQGMQIVGVMYTAKTDASPEELGRRVPLSVGVWHRHVHFCGWPNDAPRSDYEGPAPRFGFFGSIADRSACEAARGYWIPVALGWMTHVYPEGETLDERWFGRQMVSAGAGLPPGYVCTRPPAGGVR